MISDHKFDRLNCVDGFQNTIFHALDVHNYIEQWHHLCVVQLAVNKLDICMIQPCETIFNENMSAIQFLFIWCWWYFSYWTKKFSMFNILILIQNIFISFWEIFWWWWWRVFSFNSWHNNCRFIYMPPLMLLTIVFIRRFRCAWFLNDNHTKNKIN